jgi:hypothetical protein
MEGETPTGGMPAEVTRSIGAVWKRYAANRPDNVETRISGNKVLCVLHDAVGDFELGLSEQDETEGTARDMTSYRREASAAVAKATHRRVLAFISEHNAKTDTATELFLLDGESRAAEMGTPGWIAR